MTVTSNHEIFFQSARDFSDRGHTWIITFFSLEAYVIGSGEKLEISAEIQNGGEDAFNAMLYLQIPRGVNYINANSR